MSQIFSELKNGIQERSGELLALVGSNKHYDAYKLLQEVFRAVGETYGVQINPNFTSKKQLAESLSQGALVSLSLVVDRAQRRFSGHSIDEVSAHIKSIRPELTIKRVASELEALEVSDATTRMMVYPASVYIWGPVNEWVISLTDWLLPKVSAPKG